MEGSDLRCFDLDDCLVLPETKIKIENEVSWDGFFVNSAASVDRLLQIPADRIVIVPKEVKSEPVISFPDSKSLIHLIEVDNPQRSNISNSEGGVRNENFSETERLLKSCSKKNLRIILRRVDENMRRELERRRKLQAAFLSKHKRKCARDAPKSIFERNVISSEEGDSKVLLQRESVKIEDRSGKIQNFWLKSQRKLPNIVMSEDDSQSKYVMAKYLRDKGSTDQVDLKQRNTLTSTVTVNLGKDVCKSSSTLKPVSSHPQNSCGQQHNLTHLKKWSQKQISICGTNSKNELLLSKVARSQDRKTQLAALLPSLLSNDGKKPFKLNHSEPCKLETTNSFKRRLRKFNNTDSRKDRLMNQPGVKKLACSHCPARFTARNELLEHSKCHPVVKPFACVYCSSKFCSKYTLECHVFLLHAINSRNSFSCTFCSSKFTTKHDLKHHLCPKRFACVHCSLKFRSKLNLRRHILKMHTNKTSYACTHCTSTLTTKHALINHLCHMKRFACAHCPAKLGSLYGLKNHVFVLHTGKNLYACFDCPSKFTQEIDYKNHLKTHASSGTKLTAEINLKDHLKRNNGIRPYACALCPSRFLTKSCLKSHLNTHDREKPFSCTHCSKRFARKVNLISHVRSHITEKPFACTHCPARFAEKVNLSYHQSLHTGEKPYVCSHCPAKFNRKANLSYHLSLHITEKHFACTHCPAKFTQKASLIYHTNSHTMVKSKVPNKLPIKSTKKGDLNKLISIQDGEKSFECPHCPKRFPSVSNLNRHKKIHTGEKRYVCTQCPSRFVQKVQLQHHKVIHTNIDQKLFVCNLCPSGFDRKRCLSVHMKLH